MSAQTIRMRVARPLCIEGQPLPVGAEFTVDAETAAGVLQSGRGVLIDLADLGVVRSALWAAARRATVADRGVVGLLNAGPRG